MQTPIDHNPFAVLGATTRDDKRKITDLSEEKSLSFDPSVCAKARADLTNPRNRLTAEMGWLPGVSPKRAAELVAKVHSDPSDLRERGENLPSLAFANILASACYTLDEGLATAEWVKWILMMADAATKIDANATLRDINEDRTIAGFPPVKSIELIDTELADRNLAYKLAVKDALDRLPSAKLLEVVTITVDQATDSGKKLAPALIDDMVDSYALGIQTFLRQGADNIIKLVNHIKMLVPQGEATVFPQLAKLDELARKWVKFAIPIQQSMSGRGIEHDISKEVANNIRNLGLYLANDHQMIEGAAHTTKTLQACFSMLLELADRVDEDAKTLEDLQSQKQLEGVIAPIVQLCDSALSEVLKDPTQGDRQGSRILVEAEPIFIDMKTKGMSVEVIAEAKNYVGRTIMQCAIAYGNKTEKWLPSQRLLERALPLASDKALVDKIKSNIEIVQNNVRTNGGLGAITSAPSLFCFNTCGFRLYGSTDTDSTNGSHISTYYFVLGFIPIFPISRYRVIQNGSSYRFLGKYPLRKFDYWHMGISFAIIAAIILGN